MIPITVALWRVGEEPMQVVSGVYGKEKVHYEVPPSSAVPEEMKRFIDWFNTEERTDPVHKPVEEYPEGKSSNFLST